MTCAEPLPTWKIKRKNSDNLEAKNGALRLRGLKDLILMMLCSCIPISKINLISDFFLKSHMKNLAIPALSTLTTSYIPKLYSEAINYIKNTYAHSKFVLLTDETKDSKSRCVINTLGFFIESQEYILLNTSFEKTIDNLIMVKIINSVIQDYNFSWEDCLGICTDNAAYMVKAVSKIKDLYNPRLLHVRCVTHICNLAIKIIADSQLNDYFKNIMYKWFKFMKKIRGTQMLYDKYLLDHGFKVKEMPKIVESRWLCFWEACIYLHDYIIPMKHFISDIESEYGEGGIYKELKKLLINDFSVDKELILLYLSENAKDYIKVLTTTECEGPINHLLYDNIRFLQAKFSMGMEEKYFGQFYSDFIKNHMMDDTAISKILQRNHKEAFIKIKEYEELIELKDLLKSCEMFNPVKLLAQPLSFEAFARGFVAMNNLELKELQNEYIIYQKQARSINELPKDIDFYWKSMIGILPLLSRLAKNSLCFPVSNCSVERSFAQLRYIFCDRRKSFKEAGLRIHLFYAFNRNFAKKMHNIK